MSINRDRLEKRREELKLELERCRQQFIALNGAIQDLEFLLSEKDEELTETKE